MTIDSADLRKTLLSVLLRLPDRDDEDLWGSALIDSMTLVELVEALEKRYDVQFAPNDLRKENFESVACIRRTLEIAASEGRR